MSKTIANNPWLEYIKAVAFDEPQDGNESHSEVDNCFCGDSSESPSSEKKAIVTAEDIRQIRHDIVRVKAEISALFLEVEREKETTSETRDITSAVWNHVKELTKWAAEAQAAINKQAHDQAS
ncbi:hypothetical protein V8F44DRAFT_597142 [Aspergillus fumigatus]